MADAPPNDAKQVFRQCGTCSQTFGHLLNRAFGHPDADQERALTPLAGGIKNRGYQCGMLWGAALGVGAEAARRCEDPQEARGLAIYATEQVLGSFVDQTSTPDCREITGRKLDTVRGMLGLMYDTLSKGMDNSTCFELAEQWMPEAIASAESGLSEGEGQDLTRPARSCASEVVSKMGGSEDEATTVAGFAGGIGLSGNACGALGAALWMKGLRWTKEHPDKQPGVFLRGVGDKQTLKVFEDATGGEFLCEQICGRRFASIDAHSAYVEEGGCAELIDALAKS